MRAGEVAAALDACKIAVCEHLLPGGKVRGAEYEVADRHGGKGRSMKVHLNGKGTVWADFAGDERGADLLDLWAELRTNGDKGAAMREAIEWLGLPRAAAGDGRRDTKRDSGGKKGEAPDGRRYGRTPTRRDIYTDPDGAPWLAVYRYDPPGERKFFLQYDIKAGLWVEKEGHQPPHPRPLFNLHRLKPNTGQVVEFVEGEKSAAALDGLDLVATTNLGGSGSADKSDSGF